MLKNKTALRFIARLDIKTGKLIKGISLEGLRVIGDPVKFAYDYYVQGADELLYLDSVASLYERSYIEDIIKETAKNVFIPITVGGGIRNISDVEKILKSGADKVAINTAAVKNPILIKEVSKIFGSQCMVLQVDAKRTSIGYEVYIDGGREKTNIQVLDWIEKAQDLGCGEVFLTSIDKDGTRKGFDCDLINSVSQITKVPLVISGGFGECMHLNQLNQCDVQGIAIASALHYKNCSIKSLKGYFSNHE